MKIKCYHKSLKIESKITIDIRVVKKTKKKKQKVGNSKLSTPNLVILYTNRLILKGVTQSLNISLTKDIRKTEKYKNILYLKTIRDRDVRMVSKCPK